MIASCNLISPLYIHYVHVEEDSVPSKDVQINGTDNIQYNTATKYNSNPHIQYERMKKFEGRVFFFWLQRTIFRQK